MTRIERLFANLERPALITFITAGDPKIEFTVPALHALVEGGADLLELGVPFSDPEAEGPAIQASSERALANGVTLTRTLELVREFRETNQETPIVLMGYLNSVLAMKDFAAKAGDAGVDGLIMVNLPPEEADELRLDLKNHGINLIFLVAPTTTDQRARYIVSKASGFVYYVSLKGITGADHLETDSVAGKLANLRTMTDLPICVGFGIKDGRTAGLIGKHAHGVVVGSALVSRMADQGPGVEGVCQLLETETRALREGLEASQ